MLLQLKNRLILLLQLLLVMVYIVFEELIWEGIAKPIYEAIHSLKILQKLEVRLKEINASAILVLFVVLLIAVEIFGIYAGLLFVSGKMMLGLLLYLSKIPIAAFTFWLFRVTEDKLMQFAWFAWIYTKVMNAIDWLKSNEIYRDTIQHLKQMKVSLNAWKLKYLTKESLFVLKIKKLYKNIKESLKK